MDFCAVDFEMANSNLLSACAVGAAVFGGDGSVLTYRSLIRPPEGFGGFQPYNTKIHGIDPDRILRAPPFSEVWPALRPLVSRRLLVAHNAPFDTSVLRALLLHNGLAFSGCRFLCTHELSVKVWPSMPNHKLDTLCECLEIPLEHHNPESDAKACGLLALAALAACGENTLPELARSLDVRIGAVARLG